MDDGDLAPEVAALQALLAHERQALRCAQRTARRWEREAVLRAATVAGGLATRLLAAQRLAAAVERSLADSATRTPVDADVRDALRLFRDVDRPTP